MLSDSASASLWGVVPSVTRIDRLRKYGSPTEVISSALRGFIVPSAGYDFIGIDFSQVESRVTAWISNETAKLQIFRDGKDPYLYSASGIYLKPEEEITSDERGVGKVADLALGFGGADGAFSMMAKGYGVKVPEEQVKAIVKAWRQANPNIVQTWYNLQNTAIQVVQQNSSVWFPANPPLNNIAYKKSGSFLLCRLPSGREIVYPYPRLEWRNVKGKDRLCLFTKGVDSTTKKWGESQAWYGKLFENVVQGIARDLLVHAIIELEKSGYPVVLHVHDEILIEVEEGISSVDSVKIICEDTPEWSKGLPFAVKGWRGKRYKK